MSLFGKLGLKGSLKDCDYTLAAQALAHQFQGKVIKNELAQLFNQFMENPCFDTALAIMNFDPQLVVFFEESKPERFFDRNLPREIGSSLKD